MKVLNRAMVSGMVVLTAAAVSGAAAFGCTALATISTQAAAAPVGNAVTVTGASFSAAASAAPVIFHWNGVNGAEVARATPDAAGNVTATFNVPRADAGYHTIVATQQNAKGEPVYGTPARQSFQVVGADGRAPVAPALTQSPVTPSSSPDSGGVVALTLVLGAAGLTLFAAGATSMVRQGRRQAKPAAAAAVRHD